VPVHIRQPQVNERYVGLQSAEECEALGTGFSPAGHFHIGLQGNDAGQSLADDRMIINAYDSDFC